MELDDGPLEVGMVSELQTFGCLSASQCKDHHHANQNHQKRDILRAFVAAGLLALGAGLWLLGKRERACFHTALVTTVVWGTASFVYSLVCISVKGADNDYLNDDSDCDNDVDGQ
eukprot:5831307-Amphidinium_carterae.1